MKLERSKNSVNNLKWGIVYQFSGILIPFVCKAGIIRIFGINYLGLNSLFTSIITTLNLAELGFGSAVVFFMYKAIAEEDIEQICALQNLYKRVYRTIGIIILAIGLALTPFLRFLIKKDVPDDINISIIYLLTLAATAASYFMYAYKSSLLTAHQKESVMYKIRSAVLIVESVIKILAIFVFKNYYVYVAIGVLGAIAINILAAIYAKKYYPNYVPRGNLPSENLKSIGDTVRGLIFYKIGVAIVTSADSIVISAFLGLVIAGQYGNYYYIISMLFALLRIYYTSFRAGLGNSVALDSKEVTFSMFKKLQFMQKWIISWCTVCLLCLFQSFISVYAGPQNTLELGIVVCICIYFYTWKIQDVVQVYKEACGYWTKDRFRPLIGSIINLCLNILSVRYIGLYGVILSTVFVAVSIDLIWAPKALFEEYFQKSRREYYIILAWGLIDLLIMCVPTYFITSRIHLTSYLGTLVLQAIVCVIVPNVIFIAKNHKKSEFGYLMKKLNRIIKSK